MEVEEEGLRSQLGGFPGGRGGTTITCWTGQHIGFCGLMNDDADKTTEYLRVCFKWKTN